MSITSATSRVKVPLYAWLTAGFACLALMVSNGMTVSGLSVYDLAFIEEFGWSMGEIKFRDMVTLMLTGLVAPFVGIYIDRFGVRKSMLVGWVVLGLGYLAYANIDSLASMYAIHASFALVLAMCGLNLAIILVSNWFVRFRGTAIGIVLCGSSLGGALFPQYGTAMLEWVGWRDAFLVGAVFPLLMLVLTALWLRDHPGDRGLPVVGAEDQGGEATGPSVSYREALRSLTFWALALIAMTTFYTVLGVQAHIFKYMRDAGFDAQWSTNAISLFFLSALVGKFLFGLLADALPQRGVFFANLGVMFAGSLVLVGMNPDWVWPAMIAFGLGWDGVYTLLQLTVINTFGPYEWLNQP